MDEIKGDVAAGEVSSECGLIVQVRCHNLDARVTCPLASLEFPGRPHQAAQTVACFEQAWGETTSDVARRAGDGDPLHSRFSCTP